MCGISGILNFSATNIGLPQLLERMNNTLSHRGPDDEGYFFYDSSNIYVSGGIGIDSQTNIPKSDIGNIPEKQSIGLGHRRLSILDLTYAGHQPMHSLDNRYWIIMNGEIYNFIEIRETLKTKGYIFISGTDTEVVLKAFVEWGPKMFDRFNGMWALAIFDVEKQELFCSRDRFGVKPFYYYFDGKVFAFSSEQKALLQLPFLQRKLNEKAVFDYLYHGISEETETGFFRDIKELMPSHNLYVNITKSSLHVQRYYELAVNHEFVHFNEINYQEHVNEIENLIENAIKIRLRSDVPVGASLSGGVDSSALVGFIDKVRQNSEGTFKHIDALKVFTSCTIDARISEEKWAKKVIDRTNCEWYKDFPDENGLKENLENLAYVQDTPILNVNTFMHYSLMGLMKKQGIKVTLDGQGADEIFSGYPKHFPIYAFENALNGDFKPLYNSFFFKANEFSNFKNLMVNALRNSLPFYFYEKTLRTKHPEYDLIDKGFTKKFYSDKINFNGVNFNAYLKTELNGHSLRNMLKAADRNSMAHSIEGRVPFSDDINLIEYVFKTPSVYKIKNNTNKALLRDAAESILPVEIYGRQDKMGFKSPDDAWILGLQDFLSGFITKEMEPFFDYKMFHKNKDQIFGNIPSKGSLHIWRLISVGLWMKVFKMHV